MFLTHLVAKKKDQVADMKNDQAFRAIRHALLKCEAYVTGLLTDTNSSVANLAPQLEHDPSVCINNWLSIYFSETLSCVFYNKLQTIRCVYN